MKTKLTVKYYNKIALTAISILLLFISGCNEDQVFIPEDDFQYDIFAVEFPDTVWIGAAYDFPVTARLTGVNNPGKPDVSSLNGIITIPGVQNYTGTFTLTDDGTGIDNIPGDFVFSSTVSSAVFEGNSGTATLTIEPGVFGKNSSQNESPRLMFGEPFVKSVVVLNANYNTAPVIHGLTGLQDTVRFDRGEFTILSVNVEDAQGLDDIRDVIVLLYYPLQPAPGTTISLKDDGSGFDANAGDGVFSGVITHADIRTYGTGIYTVLIYAVDSAGNRSNEIIKEFYFNTEYIDYPPHITWVTAPDSFMVGGDPALIEAAAADSNGIGDITMVFFVLTRPDGTSTGDKNDMYDDGGVTSGDLIAGDGIYSYTFQIPAGSNTQLGSWKFQFTVVDKALNTNSVERFIVIY